MRCKVCGRELDPQKSYCDKCGTPVGMNSSSSEFSWNTIDFPKPKAVHDIDMQWETEPKPVQKTNADLSEGFALHNQPDPKPVEKPAEAPVYVNPQAQPQQAAPQTVQYVGTPLTWTMPSAAWNMPQPQQVVIPQPYNVQPQVIPTPTPVISAMPQMPAQPMYTQPLYVTQPMPVVQVVQAQPSIQQPTPMQVQQQAPAPVQVQQTQPSIDYKAAYDEALDHTIDPRVSNMPVAPAAIKNPINVDSWLDDQLEKVTPVSDDRFFTFHKKNEDFQKLLDEEYKRYKDKYDTNAESLKQSQIISAAEVIRAARSEKPASMQEQKQAPTPKQEQQKAFASAQEQQAPAPMQAQQTQPSIDYKAAKAERSIEEVVKAANAEKPVEEVRKANRKDAAFTKPTAPAKEETVVFNGSEFKKSAEKYNVPKAPLAEDIFDGEPVTEFDKMLEEGTTSTDELGDSTLAISNEQLRKEINDVAKKVEEAYGKQPAAKPASSEYVVEDYDKNKRQQQLESMASARHSFFNQEESDAEESTKANTQELKSIFDEWDRERHNDEDEKPRKKNRFGRFLLTVIFLVALFAAIDMTCIKFLRGRAVTVFFENVNYKVLELYGQVTGKEQVKPEENPAEQTAQEKAAAEVNKNIELITFDTETSKYVSTGEYGISNLGSKTVETDETIICALTKLIVGYNSSWVDYVNKGEDISCFDYLKTDGEAFRAASNFNRLGKQEEYKKLNIGEMRKDSNFYYVFSSELIRVTIGSTTNDVPNNLIYKIALVGDTYKIVECVSYN